MTKPAEQKRSRLLSFRMEDENLDSIDRLARIQGISRSQWIRQAVLAQLVLDLVSEKRPALQAEELPLPEPTPLKAMSLEELRLAAEADERKNQCP